MLLVSPDRSLNVLESATTRESLVFDIKLSVLIVYLHLVEALIAHAARVDNEAALSERIIVLIIIHVVTFIYASRSRPANWEGVRSWRLHKQGSAQLALPINENDPPIVKATLPELAKVDRNADFVLGDCKNVALDNSVPGEHSVVNLG